MPKSRKKVQVAKSNDGMSSTETEVSVLPAKRSKNPCVGHIVEKSGMSGMSGLSGNSGSDAELMPPPGEVAYAQKSLATSIRECHELEIRLREAVMGENRGVPLCVANEVMGIGGDFQSLLLTLIAENEGLRGRIDVMAERPAIADVATATGGRVQGVAPAQVARSLCMPTAPPVVRKPVETSSLVVKSRNGKGSSKEVAEDVKSKVAPTLGVRVHEIKPIRGGGAIIRMSALPIIVKQNSPSVGLFTHSRECELGLDRRETG